MQFLIEILPSLAFYSILAILAGGFMAVLIDVIPPSRE